MNMLRFLKESNLLEGIDSRQADAQSLKAWNWLLGQTEIKESFIRELQGMIVETQKDLPPEARGQWRRVNVMIGGHLAPSPGLVPDLINNWVLDWWTFSPKEAHIKFEVIHPFVDGNGRTGRMLMWWHEIKLGKQPTFIRSNEADRHYYYDWFRGL